MVNKVKYHDIINVSEPRAKVVAVSKTKPNQDILELYNLGHRIFGENKVQELSAKYEQLPKDIEWHFIGHLQTNKVKYIASFVHLIHSVDSLKLLKTIDKEGSKNNRVIDCLVQLKIASEDTKFGLSEQGLDELLSTPDAENFKNVRIVGVMGMATYTDNKEQVLNEFLRLKEMFHAIRDKYYKDKDYFSEISMGMSHDYELALQAESTMLRIGSKIFGERNYTK